VYCTPEALLGWSSIHRLLERMKRGGDHESKGGGERRKRRVDSQQQAIATNWYASYIDGEQFPAMDSDVYPGVQVHIYCATPTSVLVRTHRLDHTAVPG
jgi:hypothetical protein